jgi:hypothetical protein
MLFYSNHKKRQPLNYYFCLISPLGDCAETVQVSKSMKKKERRGWVKSSRNIEGMKDVWKGV